MGSHLQVSPFVLFLSRANSFALAKSKVRHGENTYKTSLRTKGKVLCVKVEGFSTATRAVVACVNRA